MALHSSHRSLSLHYGLGLSMLPLRSRSATDHLKQIKSCYTTLDKGSYSKKTRKDLISHLSENVAQCWPANVVQVYPLQTSSQWEMCIFGSPCLDACLNDHAGLNNCREELKLTNPWSETVTIGRYLTLALL